MCVCVELALALAMSNKYLQKVIAQEQCDAYKAMATIEIFNWSAWWEANYTSEAKRSQAESSHFVDYVVEYTRWAVHL